MGAARGARAVDRYHLHMGDPACFLAATCIECGRFLEETTGTCPHCGADLSEQDAIFELPVGHGEHHPG